MTRIGRCVSEFQFEVFGLPKLGNTVTQVGRDWTELDTSRKSEGDASLHLISTCINFNEARIEMLESNRDMASCM